MKAVSPNGAEIVGTLEHTPGTAVIQDVRKDPETGRLAFDYAGETDMNWDAQTTATDDQGRRLFVDETGEIWPEDAVVLQDDAS